MGGIMVVATLLEHGERALAANKFLRETAAELRADAHSLRYRSRRFMSIRGASDLESEEHRIRELLRTFVSPGNTTQCDGSFSRGSVCGACGKTIKRYDLEYDLIAGGGELRIDQACYALFVEEIEAGDGRKISGKNPAKPTPP